MIFGLIYLARNIYNKKVYVGATTNHLEVRKHAHVLASKNTKYMEYHNSPFLKALLEVGDAGFEWEIIEQREFENKKALFKREEDLTLALHADNPEFGYNINVGATKGVLARKRMSENHANMFGSNNPNFNKPRSTKTKEKISKKLLGRKDSIDTRKKKATSRQGVLNPAAKKVQCIETGQIFSTAREASATLGLNSQAVSVAIHQGCRSGGYTWVYL